MCEDVLQAQNKRNISYAAVITTDEKYGIIDKTGKPYFPFTKKNMTPFSGEGIALIWLNDSTSAFINLTGDIIASFSDLYIQYNRKGMMSKIRKDDKWGFIDNAGKGIVVPCIYDDVKDFHEEMAMVKTDEKWGFIDNTGKMVVPCIYDDARDFQEGMAKVEKDGQQGFIDKSGRLVVPFGSYSNVYSFCDGMAMVDKGAYMRGFIDKTGKLAIPCIYEHTRDFQEGMAIVKKEGKYGLIDKSGKLLVLCDDVDYFHEGMAQVKKDGKNGFIDKSGKLVVPYIYDSVGEFHEGMAQVEKNGKWGSIDKSGKLIVPCIYDSVGEFHEGRTLAKKDGKWGFINQSGKVAVPHIYDDAEDYHEGMAQVKKDGMWGFIDKSGKLVVPCIYDDVSAFHDGMAQVVKDDKWGFVDKTGNLVIPCIYDGVSDFYSIEVTDSTLNPITSNNAKTSQKSSGDIVMGDKSDTPVENPKKHDLEALPFMSVAVKPSFQGGDTNAFMQWVRQNLVYPESAKTQGIEGRVNVEFVIKEDGSLVNPKIVRGLHPTLDQEALRVLRLSPKWRPGQNDGKPVSVRMSLPIVFQNR